MLHRFNFCFLALAITFLLSLQAANSQTLDEILELVQKDSTALSPIKKWRTLSQEEAAEAEHVLSEIWNAAVEEADSFPFWLRHEIEIILAQLDGLEEFHLEWRSSQKYRSSPIRSVDIPVPYDQTAMSWAADLLDNHSDEELVEAFRSREDTFNTPIGRIVSRVSVWKAALHRERNTKRGDFIKKVLQDIVAEGGPDSKIAAEALLEEAMRTCDLVAFDTVIAEADISNWIKHAFWRARITQGGAKPSYNAQLFERPSQALAGYEAILQYGYCNEEFIGVGQSAHETYKINIIVDGDGLQRCPDFSNSKLVSMRCQVTECLIVVETNFGYHLTFHRNLSDGKPLRVNLFEISDFTEIPSSNLRPDIKCVRQEDDTFCLSIRSSRQDSCLAAGEALMTSSSTD